MESVYGPSYRCRHETDELLQIDNEELPREQILREPECINLGFPNCLSQRCCLSNDLHIPPCISQPQPLYSKISISSLERTLQRQTGELNNNLELHKKHQTQEF